MMAWFEQDKCHQPQQASGLICAWRALVMACLIIPLLLG